MKQLSNFLDKTELKTEPVGESEFDELLAGQFINPCGKKLKVESTDPDNPASNCDTDKLQIKGLDKFALDRINRLLRLKRRLGWPISLVDRLIMSPAVSGASESDENKLNDYCLQKLATIVDLADSLDIESTAAAAWFADLPTFGEQSLYRRLFMQASLSGNAEGKGKLPGEEFYLDNLCPPAFCWPKRGRPKHCRKLEDHRQEISSALGMSQEDLSLILRSDWSKEKFGIDGEGDLSLWNLSRIWAWGQFAKKLRLRMDDLVSLLDLLDINDLLDEPKSTTKVVHAANLLNEWGLSIQDLRFWLLHESEEGDGRELDDFKITGLLSDLQMAFKELEEEKTRRAIVVDEIDDKDRNRQELVPGDDKTTCIEKLDYALSQIPDLAADDARVLTALLQERDEYGAKRLQGILAQDVLINIDGVKKWADHELVTLSETWPDPEYESRPTAEQEQALKIHQAHQAWAHGFLNALLEHLNQFARRQLVVERRRPCCMYR